MARSPRPPGCGHYLAVLELRHLQPSTNEHRSEVLHSYSNRNPQLDGAIDSMAAPSKSLASASGPSWQPRPDCDPTYADGTSTRDRGPRLTYRHTTAGKDC